MSCTCDANDVLDRLLADEQLRRRVRQLLAGLDEESGQPVWPHPDLSNYLTPDVEDEGQ